MNWERTKKRNHRAFLLIEVFDCNPPLYGYGFLTQLPACFFIRGTILYRGGEGGGGRVSRKIEWSISISAWFPVSVMEIDHIRYRSIYIRPYFYTGGKLPVNTATLVRSIRHLRWKYLSLPSTFFCLCRLLLLIIIIRNRLIFNHGRKLLLLARKEIFSERISSNLSKG